MKKVVLFLIGLLFLVKPVFGATYPSPTGNISDFSGTLTKDQVATIEQNLQDYRNSTGNEIAVAVVKDLGGDTIENYAVKLFEQWKIGQKENSNGILLLVAVNDHLLRIEVGYGLEPYLTDAQSGDIIRNVITPKFKQNDYAGGILDGVNAIENTLSGKAPTSTNTTVKNSPSGFDTILGIISFFLFFGFWLIAAFLRRITKFLADTPGFLAGPLGGVLAGGIVGFLVGSIIGAVVLAMFLGFIGFILDFFASRIYHALDDKKKNSMFGRTVGFWTSFGPRNSSGGGGFSGFSGGSSGGGGTSGSW